MKVDENSEIFKATMIAGSAGYKALGNEQRHWRTSHKSYSAVVLQDFAVKLHHKSCQIFFCLDNGGPDPLACVIRKLPILNRLVGGALRESCVLL